MKRLKLLLVLATMPEETFGWFVAWASGAMAQFPDGQGGFQRDSQAAIKALREAANEYMKQP